MLKKGNLVLVFGFAVCLFLKCEPAFEYNLFKSGISKKETGEILKSESIEFIEKKEKLTFYIPVGQYLFYHEFFFKNDKLCSARIAPKNLDKSLIYLIDQKAHVVLTDYLKTYFGPSSASYESKWQSCWIFKKNKTGCLLMKISDGDVNVVYAYINSFDAIVSSIDIENTAMNKSIMDQLKKGN